MPPITKDLPVSGASVTSFDRFGDSRGYFNELYNAEKYDESLNQSWKQVSFSSSQKHALRGLHCSPYGKFITCVRGAFYDVIADFREDSPTFGRWCGVLLTENNKKQVYVPARCGHGFFTIEDDTCALYLQEGCFNPANEADTHPFDPLFNVAWPVPEGVTPVMSPKDTAAPPLSVRRPHLCTRTPRGRILIIGASGQVGGALMDAFGPQNCIGTYCGTKVEGMIQFDLAQCAMQPQLADDLITTVYPTLVCICAGFTWVDGCERDAPKANAMNNSGPVTLAKAAKAHGARVVWYSTDYVFDGGVKGAAGPYGEEDAVSPLNVYGSSKLKGEEEMLKVDDSALVIRTNVVFGPEGVGKNFVYQLVRKLRANEPMNVPNDQVNTPTYNRDLAEATRLLVEKGARGLFNIGGSEVLDRLAFAKVIVEAINKLEPAGAKLDAALLNGVTTSNAGQAALRPLASGLKLDKLKAVLPEWKPSTIHEALENWLKQPIGKPLGE
mmetsp:Transcript_53545/g.88906  ORF Transcript_53545/g.88906 Transcript_53545/m.88906 type:complete len:497 (+) Transcript_53545:23-1513(+)